MERLRSQYRYYANQKQQSIAHSQSFQQDFPETAQWMRQSKRPNEKAQVNTLTHWFLLIFFGLLAATSFSQQLFLVIILTAFTALIKGPGMFLFGLIYSFLVGLFPPLSIVLSALFFLISLYQLTRNWRFGMAAAFFYFYPLLLNLLQQFTFFEETWFLILAIAVGLFLFHLLILHVYQEQPSSKALAWSLISLPYDCLLFLIPSKRGKLKQIKRKK